MIKAQRRSTVATSLALILLLTTLLPGQAQAGGITDRVKAEVAFHWGVFTTASLTAAHTYATTQGPAALRERKAAGTFLFTVFVAETVRFSNFLFTGR